jgi:hypothetical protein
MKVLHITLHFLYNLSDKNKQYANKYTVLWNNAQLPQCASYMFWPQMSHYQGVTIHRLTLILLMWRTG